MKSLVKNIQNFAGRYGLWKKGDRIIAAVSGGPDSVCLLDVLVKLAPKYNFKLRVAHINYGLRGKDSNRDEKFVRELARKYRLEIEVMKYRMIINKAREKADGFQIPLTPFSKGGVNSENQIQQITPSLWEGGRLEGKTSLASSFSPEGKEGQANENHLRKIRYDFFEKIRKKEKCDLIAVAHNQDDQAETVLMRILRGAGLRGLAAMRPSAPSPHPGFLPQGNKNVIIRPLLNTSRKEILEYLKANKLKYRTDITNKDIKIFRNKIRHRLIPYLEKNYNPNIKKTLADMALVIADDYDYLLANEERAIKRAGADINKKGGVILSAKKIQKLHPAVQRQCLRKIISQIKTDLTDIEAGHIEEIVKITASAKSKIQKAEFKGLKIKRKGDKVRIWIN